MDPRSDTQLRALAGYTVGLRVRELRLFNHNGVIFFLKVGGYAKEGPFQPFSRNNCSPLKWQANVQSTQDMDEIKTMRLLEMLKEKELPDRFAREHPFPKYCVWL
jgi:hypothetical protein